MAYRAQVQIQGDPAGMHTRPASWVAWGLRGLDAVVQFRRGEYSITIRPELAMIDILQAAADLQLERGAEFEIWCDGPQAREAISALQERFTSRYFEGSEFLLVEQPAEADHA